MNSNIDYLTQEDKVICYLLPFIDNNIKNTHFFLNWNNKATKYLKILYQPKSGYFCDSCASDLRWHGIVEEVD